MWPFNKYSVKLLQKYRLRYTMSLSRRNIGHIVGEADIVANSRLEAEKMLKKQLLKELVINVEG